MTILERDTTQTIDLVPTSAADRPAEPPPAPATNRPPEQAMRIRRVRLRSVAAIATVFSALAYLTVVGTLVAIWNVALALGFVETVEDTVTDALGLQERFTLVGDDLFSLAMVGVGLLVLFGLVVTVLLALVYNVASAAFGGLAIELGPLRRPHRVYSLRHRRFITVHW